MFCDHTKQFIFSKMLQNTGIKNYTCLDIYSLSKERKKKTNREKIRDKTVSRGVFHNLRKWTATLPYLLPVGAGTGCVYS